MPPLIAVTIIKSGVVHLVISIRRLVVRRSFYWQRDLVDKFDVVIKIHVGNVCEGIPCEW